MIYECQNSVLHIVGVERMLWKSGEFHITPRKYSALAFRVSGTATITANGKEYFINSNDVLYMPQGVSYHAVYSDTEILVIHFITVQDDNSPEVYTFENTEQIYNAFSHAHILWQEKPLGFEAFICSQLYYIFGKMCESESTIKMPEYFLTALSYINSNYADNTLSIDKVCYKSGICATSLRLLFQKFYKKTPMEYITKSRLESARNLISCGVPIAQAAEQSGFNDPKYFARVVKKHFGCTPREFKTYGK